MTAWMTASISIRAARAPATATIVLYSPSNQRAPRFGLVVFSTRVPTWPVTHTAASVTHTVTPRITKSLAADAAVPTAPVTASQTFPTTGSWHGSARVVTPARPGVANGPATAMAAIVSPSAKLTSRSCAVGLRLGMAELLEARNRGEEVTRGCGRFRRRERRRGPWRACKRSHLPRAVFPHEIDDLRSPRLLRLDRGSAADDSDVPDGNGRLGL